MAPIPNYTIMSYSRMCADGDEIADIDIARNGHISAHDAAITKIGILANDS